LLLLVERELPFILTVVEAKMPGVVSCARYVLPTTELVGAPVSTAYALGVAMSKGKCR